MLNSIPFLPRLLGLAGLVPMAALLWLVLTGGDTSRFAALALGWFYAALIFSFLGGLWWGLAAAAGTRTPAWLWIVSVVPSLAALATLIPWLFGEPWPGPSLVWLGLAILVSPLVDRQIAARGLTPPWWLALRIILSGGLGTMAIVMGLAA
ncbi:MAG: DUF3429 domain-containing protein [Sphingopyxis sp.]|nr:DUF3429 domain-containing protein [Sphingopyxis sp.]